MSASDLKKKLPGEANLSHRQPPETLDIQPNIADHLEPEDFDGEPENLTTRFLQKRENRLDRQTLRLAQALIKAGFKVTDPRLAVIEEIVSFNREFEINELTERLEKRPDFKPGIASIFRAVKLLTELGLLQRLHSGDGCHRYGLARGHNHQIICRCCDRTVEFEGCDFSTLTDFLEKQSGFRLEGHWIEFYGLCQDCGRVAPAGSDAIKAGNLNLVKSLPPHEHHPEVAASRPTPLSVREVSQNPV